MAYLHDERDQDFRGSDDIEHSARARDRELTLSTGTILAVFFGLALSWGAFFAFGYNMGSKTKTVSAAAATTGEGAPVNEANFSNFKPSSGTPAIDSVAGSVTPKDAAAASRSTASASAYPSNAAESSPVKPPPATARTVAVPAPAPNAEPVAAPPARVAAAPRPAPSEPLSGPAPAGAFMVQIAAVTHQEDADLEMSSLRRRGYTVVSRTAPDDRFIHIQVGPFATKKDAEAMRQRLITDGYNAILK